MKTTLAMSALALSLGLALSRSLRARQKRHLRPLMHSRCQAAPMLEKVMPSVVSINVEGSTTVNTPRMPRNFQQFFGDNSPFCQMGLLSRVRRFAGAADRAVSLTAASSRNLWRFRRHH